VTSASETSAWRFALVGTPNSGKTALFNALTGSRQKVANYPGVTVERKAGIIQTPGGHRVDLVDLPGTYSLRGRSPDEEITRDIVLGRLASEAAPDLLLCVADATNLRVALRLVIELKQVGRPLMLVLNMIDIARRRGIDIDLVKLSKELGVPVVTSTAVRRGGTEDLMRRIDAMAAGASDAGRQLAAETAEMVFTALANIKAGQAFCADVRDRMKKAGRDPDHMTIMPACMVVLGETKDEAQSKRNLLDSKVNYANAIASLSIAIGHDAAKFDPDKPLPDDIPETNASKSGRERAIALGKRENLTVRQLAQRLGGFGGLAMVGTAKSVADEMEEWLMTNASDGFTLQFPYLPGGLEDFCNQVVPELQRRGLFRKEYEGKTLRENLGLPRPDNRFFQPKATAAE